MMCNTHVLCMHLDSKHGLSQDLETGWPNVFGILYFKGNHIILRLQPYTCIHLLIEIRHNVFIQFCDVYIWVKIINYIYV